MPDNRRLLSLDFFRGITIAAMILVNNPGSWTHVYPPLLHAKWHGWTSTDLIFPFFLFIVGVSITLALSVKKQNHADIKSLYIKIIRRTLLLFALGLFLSGFPFFDLTSIRIPGVLQRIAVCYFFAAVIFLNCNSKAWFAWAIGLMLIYWAAMEWFPVPGAGAGSYALFMSGMAMLVLGVAYYLIDIRGWQKGTTPFRVYGMNAITVFVLSGIVGRLLYLIKWPSGQDIITLKDWLMNTFFLGWLSPLNASLAYALCFVFISYLAMYYLYKKQIFIKI